MAKVNVFDILYSEEKSPLDFHFDSLVGPNISLFFNEYEIKQLYDIASSAEMAGNPRKKKQMINSIVEPKGFKRIFSGTNRVIYRYMEDLSFCLKIAFDSVGLSDSLREYENQFYLKPFCVKIFDTHPTGIIATVEFVQPIRTIVEFGQVAEDVYDLIVNKIIGRYVLDDIGCLEFFQNYGIRKGFGPVLLDFPYMYILDGNKLYCSIEDKVTHRRCNGVIDYDETFDNIICTKCGKRYFAKDLKKNIENKTVFVEGDVDMSKVYIYRGDKLIETKGGDESNYINRSYDDKKPSTKQQQLYDDFIRNDDPRLRLSDYEDNDVDTRIANTIIQSNLEPEHIEYVEPVEKKVNTFIPPLPQERENSTSTYEPNIIPENLGEIISANSLDDEEMDYSTYINDNNETSQDEEMINAEDNKDEEDTFEKIHKTPKPINNDDFY